MIVHQIEALVGISPSLIHIIFTFSSVIAGVDEIVLAVNYRPEVMVAVLKDTEEKYGIRITFSVETEPFAGPLALAKDILGKDDSPFFVLNF
ncbi:uncharacterized protein MELLADRAFT_87670 [Melampsora larici-populina 98AG31]|uniref:Nucleotidyl transferase domain-containing protein n=1 Tax=Melampsora larici-populina (strain 98AG31 / pathotype 3-4-7) TaxID=747676 RepID=F4RP99_MELLP|nr:uncharacterized protein MELLADRAFT_87670 [Melampsora larici-populina 98AG31]EGG05886.1 hypothetical protein MELLADRAFT_87670 [Melampsora larici-populina 98AG31]